ncbi:hypothetical protein KIF59_14355 [Enterobacter cloacae subsp. cloacae]|nr:hypothetical protein [Enterobacter cloacae subsp. cloacae]
MGAILSVLRSPGKTWETVSIWLSVQLQNPSRTRHPHISLCWMTKSRSCVMASWISVACFDLGPGDQLLSSSLNV